MSIGNVVEDQLGQRGNIVPVDGNQVGGEEFLPFVRESNRGLVKFCGSALGAE
jgi:hypothetical protein